MIKNVIKENFVKQVTTMNKYKKEIKEEVENTLNKVLVEGSNLINESTEDAIANYFAFRNNSEVKDILSLKTAENLRNIMLSSRNGLKLSLKEAMKVAYIGNLLLEFEETKDEFTNMKNFLGNNMEEYCDKYEIKNADILHKNLSKIKTKEEIYSDNLYDQLNHIKIEDLSLEVVNESVKNLLLIKELSNCLMG